MGQIVSSQQGILDRSLLFLVYYKQNMWNIAFKQKVCENNDRTVFYKLCLFARRVAPSGEKCVFINQC